MQRNEGENGPGNAICVHHKCERVPTFANEKKCVLLLNIPKFVMEEL